MSYQLLRKLLFTMDPENSHEFSLDWMSALHRIKLLEPFLPSFVADPVEVMGIQFPNRVGLAAGLDKNGAHIDALGSMGFGFVEVGTVTPRPQPGNPKPRLFRLKDNLAIINRMGFNNEGVDFLLDRVKASAFPRPIGINIGKNFDTPVEDATSDYLIGMRKVYSQATYITVNVSSPNTPGLRSLQFGDSLNRLLEEIKREQEVLAKSEGRYVPVAIKIAPDMTEEEVALVGKSIQSQGLDAIIAGNTTLSRAEVEGFPYADEAGGLSGAPLTSRSTQVIKTLKDTLRDTLPIIGVGGIMSGADAAEKIAAGASLVQIYTGFIYRGPGLVKDSVESIKQVR